MGLNKEQQQQADNQERMKQMEQLFAFMMQQSSLLVMAIVANPESPRGTIQYCKASGVSDADAVIILRSLAERIENGTSKIALPI